MPYVDPNTGEYSEVAYGVDTHSLVSNQGSIFDSAANVLTKGVPLTGLSIVNSFANTAIDAGNWLGLDNKRLTIEDEVGQGDMLDYYKSHETGIEAAGLIVGSLIPGTIAVKALKLAQAGRFTNTLAKATGIFSGPKDEIVKAAMAEVEAGPSGLFGSLDAEKYKAIALGFGDQALQALTYEAATLGTMKASPLLDNYGYKEVVSDMFWGALVGGGIGGVLEGIATRATFNKILFNQDLATKSQELATYLGRGGYGAGDRVAVLLDSIDKIPSTSSKLGSIKKEATETTAVLQAKKILSSLAPDGENDITNAMFDTLMKMKNEAGMDKEEMYNYLSRLSKVSRITDTDSTASGGIFYVNRFAKSGEATWENLVTNTPEAKAGVSLGYELKAGASEVKIARFNDTVDFEGHSVPRFNSGKEAFEAGHDVFINKNLEVVVNENSPNIRRVARPGESRALSAKEEALYRETGKLPEGSSKLYGAPLVLNVATSNITDKALPVIGDFGGVKYLENGVTYGDKVSIQSATPVKLSDLAEGNYLDAQARYMFAASKTLPRNTVIGSQDIPYIEALYHEFKLSNRSFDNFIAMKTKQGLKFSDGFTPQSEDSLLALIKARKDELLTSIFSKEGSKMSAEEAALRANVSETYIENFFKADKVEDFLIKPDRWETVNHVKLEYDLGNVVQQDGNILRGLVDTQYRIQVIKDSVRSNLADFIKGEDWDRFLIDATASEANILGAGSKMFSFSSAAYGSLGQKAERVGKYVGDYLTTKMQEVSSVLASPVNAIRNDPAASAELGMFIAVRRRTGEKFVMLDESLASQHFLDAKKAAPNSGIAVLKDAVSFDSKTGEQIKYDPDYLPGNFINGGASAQGKQGNYNYYVLSEKVAAFEKANQAVNDTRLGARNNWYAAQGLTTKIETGTLYTPPIDTSKYPHFAYVKSKPGYGMGDDGVAVITAVNAQELEQKIASLSDRYSVYTKDLLKLHHEVIGDYEYARNFSQSQVDNMLVRKGLLNNIYPDTRAETIIKDYVDWHTRQETRLIRDHVETGNGQLFAELRAMGQRFTAAETSKTGFVASVLGRSAPNPYNSYINLALNISSKENYRLWADANEKLEAFFDTAFRAARTSFLAASKDLLPFEEASKVAERYGLGNPYGTAIENARSNYETIANKLPPGRYLTKFVSTANSVLGATTLKLDAWQSFIEAVSTPILTMSEGASVRKLLQTELPDGSGRQIPATSKVLFSALSNFFDSATREERTAYYRQLGAIRQPGNEYYQMIDSLTLPYGKFTESSILANMKKAVELGSKISGAQGAEFLTSFMAADVGRQLFEAAGYSGRQLSDNIMSFVNRVKTNLTTAQRPVAFQGPLGQAVGLFQSYQFNLMQNLFRYVESGEGKTIAILAGMQTTLFGLQGLPGFQAINNHIIGNAAGNSTHKDLYSTIPNLVDKKLGDYLLYGVTSNWLSTGLYTRGDINPRQITLLPVNPMDYPAISGGIRLVSNLLNTAERVAKGADISSSLLLGLEHNGLSRPLTGLAQLAQGFTTTAQGSLISAIPGSGTGGLNELFSGANFARLLGARPLDEAITLDTMFRRTLYQAKNTARSESLGAAVKTEMYGGSYPDPETVNNFVSEFAKTGGDITTFSKHMMKWTSDANASVANKIFKSLKNPLNQNMMQIMGGKKLPDFYQLQDAPSVE